VILKVIAFFATGGLIYFVNLAMAIKGIIDVCKSLFDVVLGIYGKAEKWVNLTSNG